MITTCDFRLVCPKNWHEMADLPDGSGKFCAQCRRPVVTVRTRRQFDAAARRGDCVAVLPSGREATPPQAGAPGERNGMLLTGEPLYPPPPPPRRR